MSGVPEAGQAKPKSPFTVGQKVIIERLERYAEPQEGVVVKIARRWMTVAVGSYGTEQKFDAVTGAQESGQYSPYSWASTPEMVADREERADLSKRLNAAGLEFRLGAGGRVWTIEKLRAVVAAAESGESS